MLGNFDYCLAAFWTWDGFKNDKAKGEHFATSYGVTEFSWKEAQDDDVISKELAMVDAEIGDFRTVLLEEFWNKVQGDKLPLGVDLMIFNDATLSGVGHAASLVQRCVNLPESEIDGIIGPRTLFAISGFSAQLLIAKIAFADHIYLSHLKNAPLYLRGWLRRESVMQQLANKMIASSQGVS